MPDKVFLFGCEMRYVRYQSKGNTVGLDESIDDYWELDDSGCVVRSVSVQANGAWLRYDTQHQSDQFGQLPEGAVSEADLLERSYGTTTLLTREEFESMWDSTSAGDS